VETRRQMPKETYIHVMMWMKWFWLLLEGPVTTVKRRSIIYQISVLRKPGLVMTIVMQVIACNHCGNIGHNKYDCWQLEENKNKRPENFCGGSGHGHTAIRGEGKKDEDGPKFLMCTLCSREEKFKTIND
jgi:hypothetical protein